MNKKLTINDSAPDFILNDTSGNPVQLSRILRDKKNVVLILNLGFF